MSLKRCIGPIAISTLSATLCFGGLQIVKNDELAGQGLGAVATVLVVQDGSPQGANLTGCIGRSGSSDQRGSTFVADPNGNTAGGTGGCTGSSGDVQQGQSQTLRYDDEDLEFDATSDASQIGVVYNSTQAQSSGGKITLYDLVLRIYAADGTILFTSSGLYDFEGDLVGSGGLVLDVDEAGVGGSRFLFVLDDAQRAIANTYAFGAGYNAGNRFAISVNTGCSDGSGTGCFENTSGPETINIVKLESTSEVPEPGTWGVVAGAIAVFGIYRRRRTA